MKNTIHHFLIPAMAEPRSKLGSLHCTDMYQRFGPIEHEHDSENGQAHDGDSKQPKTD